MSNAFKITYKLRSSTHVGIIPIPTRSVKCRDVRALVAERLSTQEDDLALYTMGSTSTEIHLDEDIQSFSMLEVVRGLLNTSNSANRTLTATQQKQRKDAKEIKAVIGASGAVTMLQRGGMFQSSASEGGGAASGIMGASQSAAAGAGASEDEAIRKMQEQIAVETGVDGVIRRPMFRGPPPGGIAGGATSGPDGNLQFREPPKGYICHNCGKGGHHINHCPEARNGFNKVKVLQAPVGIPESMLERCAPDDPRAKFVTRDGITVVRKQVTNAFEDVNLAAVASSGYPADASMVPPELLCKVCQKPLTMAVKSPCCGVRCCEACLLQTMDDSNGSDDGPPLCPLCEEPLMVDDISADEEARGALMALYRKRPRSE